MAAPPPTDPPVDPIDALYTLPLDGFVEARNRLAALTAKGGDKPLAASIKSLAKPSLSAWAANQVYWRDRAFFDELAKAVEAARNAQGSDIRGAMETRRKALAAAAKRAVEMLEESGSPASPETLRRVSNSLEALTTMEPSDEIRPGRLSRDIDPPGFDALAGWSTALPAPGRERPTARLLKFQATQRAPAPSKAETRKEEETRKAAIAAARAALGEAEKKLADARREAARSERRAAQARSKAQASESERIELESRLAAATAKSQNLAREAREMERQAGAAALELRQAEIELARAKGRSPVE